MAATETPAPAAAPVPAPAAPPVPVAAPPPVVDDPTAVAPPLTLSAQEYYLKGLRAYSTGDLPTAIEHWRNCLDLDAEHPKAKKALARAMRELK